MFSGSSFGKRIKVTIFGGSHEARIGVTMEGLPKGVKIDLRNIERMLERRRPGQNEFSTARNEPDKPVIKSGLHNGVTFGPPLSVVIENTDVQKQAYQDFYDTPRPSHADYTGRLKYGSDVSLSGGGPFSGRMTAPLCVAGAIAAQILEGHRVCVGARVFSIGAVRDEAGDPARVTETELLEIRKKPFPVRSDAAGQKMREEILSAKQDGDSVGGVVECCVLGFPPGIGGPLYDGVESALAPILFGIPAAKAVEFGAGFGSSLLRGSENNDPFYAEKTETGDHVMKTRTNNHGGILGGVTSGMPIIARVAFKPTPSIAIEQDTARISTGENVKLTITGRHDPCVALRAVPVVESAMAIGLLDLLLARA